ncbi:MAG: NAAT family transporter [Burkholderiales bacterium]|nr:NAAT family transporter [Burkholderiales bacterium]
MIAEDIRHFLTALLLVVGSLLPIVNPVGSAPMFLAMTRGSDAATRQMLALKVAINSFALIIGSLIIGAYVLRIFGISVPVVQVAGGAVLCALGWNLLNSDPAVHADASPPASSEMVFMRAFYPLTLPLTVDPGAISVAITVGANHAHGVGRVLIGLAAGIIGAALISLSVWLAYRYAERVAHWLGHTRVMVVLRLSAFIVLCIGVEITWNGIHALLVEVKFAPPAATTPEGTASAESPVAGFGAARTALIAQLGADAAGRL